MLDLLNFHGKTVLVVGGATGMGAAAAKAVSGIGAEVVVMDVADVQYATKQSIKLDLRDPMAIDEAVKELPARIDAVFCCAGVADGSPCIMLVNFIGQRYLLDKLIDKNILQRGGAITAISSVAGLPWEGNIAAVRDFLDNKDWGSSAAWIAANEGTDSYSFSKQAWNAYVSRESLNYIKRGIRINAILPGPTDTPLARANADFWLGFGSDYRQAAGVEPHTPEHMGHALVFLCSDMAAGINGVILPVDYGHVSASKSGSWSEPAINMLLGIDEGI